MRICHILETAGGGSGQIVLDLITGGLRLGDDISVIYSPVRAEAGFVEALKAYGDKIKIIALPMHRHITPLDIVSAVRLHGILRKYGPFDIVNSHSSKAGALARIAGIFLPGCKQVYTPHAFITMAPDAPMFYGIIERMLSLFSDLIICTSEQEKRHARLQLRIDDRKLRVVNNGVHLHYPADRLSARARIRSNEGDFVLGFVGRLVAQKNPMRLVQAFAVMAPHYPQLRLAIVGAGQLREELGQFVDAHGLGARVAFMGSENGREIMPGFDALVCSSDYESFGLVILEAMAAGVPVVSTRVGVAEDAIVNAEAGYLSQDFSATALAQAITQLLVCTDARRAEMGQYALSQAERFSIERMAQETKAIYEELVPAAQQQRLLNPVT